MELAIIFPLFGLMIFAIIIGGIYYDAGNAAQAAANIAVNEARVYGATAEQGEQAAEDFIASNAKNLHDTTVAVDRSATEVTVTVTARTNSIFESLFNSVITRTAVAPVERWVN
ncbi:TadE/TadG family type IV pilus assembly protein [Microbacterium sp. No. 7]|uniref:TadE/TadG family type IV pilus assembly protein n=1 Tax=Microbacterium sp. No. 7 TaxID=1714373 RepID=UPI0006D19745|nr:TadE/TadG family type IV pilus assembly protein [Microbacterium sp. No. 7]ALJ22528.1 pilus assembly protein TadE [Microbacterium sp. No. 7]